MFNSDISHQFGHMFTVTLYFKTKKNSSFISVWNHIFFPCTAGEMLKKKHKHASLFSSVRLTGASAAWETSSTGTSSPPSSWGTPPGLSSNWPWVPRCTKATWCVQYHFVCWSLLYAPRSALGNLCFKLKEKSGGDWWKDIECVLLICCLTCFIPLCRRAAKLFYTKSERRIAVVLLHTFLPILFIRYEAVNL